MQITVDTVYTTFQNLNFRLWVQPSIHMAFDDHISIVFDLYNYWMMIRSRPSIHEGLTMQFHVTEGMERRMSTGTPNGCRKLSFVVPGGGQTWLHPKCRCSAEVWKKNCLLMMLDVWPYDRMIIETHTNEFKYWMCMCMTTHKLFTVSGRRWRCPWRWWWLFDFFFGRPIVILCNSSRTGIN